MTPQRRKRIILIAIAVLVLAAIVYAFLPDPVQVETAEVRRAPLQVIVEEEGQTAVADRYAITAPVAGFLRRIALEEGDAVTAGAPVATLEPPRAPILDPRSRTEAAARVRAAEVTAVQTEAERARVQRLADAGAATRQALEQAVSDAARARAELDAARAALRATSGPPSAAAATVLRAPAGGRVLAIGRRSEGQVSPGDTLIVVGDTDRLEIRTNVLSQDAVRIRPGTRVLIEQWGDESVLEGAVTRVEPQAHTEVSSLGVEEQRVPVIATLTTPAPASLGSGYRVLARFVLWEADAALQVPASALFRTSDDWAVFAVVDGRAVRRTVRIGQQAGLATQVLEGLTEGDEVIVHPGNAVSDGVRVERLRRE
ncbi:MAG TPA: efflux RND transporter periplasmic adaptor subunit [Longimicrobiales bacterium]|nr:efflux RND transporter periplasmic adaptor subunit [Longimicrobiales bacterium]